MSHVSLNLHRRLDHARLQRLSGLLFVLLLLAVLASLRAIVYEPGKSCFPGPAHAAQRVSALFAQQSYCWALIGNDGSHLAKERSAGIMAKVFRLSWRSYAPSANAPSREYIERKGLELAQLREAGFEVILNLGIHDPPQWTHNNYADSYYNVSSG